MYLHFDPYHPLRMDRNVLQATLENFWTSFTAVPIDKRR